MELTNPYLAARREWEAAKTLKVERPAKRGK